MNRWVAKLLWSIIAGTLGLLWSVIKTLASPLRPTQKAKAIDIVDGDSLVVQNPKDQVINLRIRGIDAPEYGQEGFWEAKNALESLTEGKDITIIDPETDNYGRTIATIEVEGQSIAKSLTEEGLSYPSKFNRDQEIERASQKAKTSRKGIWGRNTQQDKPWDFRNKNNQTPDLNL